MSGFCVPWKFAAPYSVKFLREVRKTDSGWHALLLERYARLNVNRSRSDVRDNPKIRYKSFCASISSMTAWVLVGFGGGSGLKSEDSDDEEEDAEEKENSELSDSLSSRGHVSEHPEVGSDGSEGSSSTGR